MAILHIQQQQTGRVGVNPQKLLINTDNTIAEVTAAGYLTKYGSYSSVQFSDYQLAEVYTTDGKVGVYQVSVDADGIASLTFNRENPNAVNIHNAPVTDKHFVAFYETDGTIQDLEWSASDPSYTTVAMVSALPTSIGYVAKFSDTNGSIRAGLGGAVSNAGDFIAGDALTPGKFTSFPAIVSTGTLTFQAIPNAADYAITVKNRSHAQVSSRYIPDIGATGDFLLTTLANPDANINLVRFDASVTTAALNSGAVTLFTSSGSKQYKVVALWLNYGANLTTGNKNLAISDGTTTYSVIPSASLLTLVNAQWGSTALPFPSSAALTTSTAAGASLTATYSGGTTNYDSGSTIVISGILQRVA